MEFIKVTDVKSGKRELIPVESILYVSEVDRGCAFVATIRRGKNVYGTYTVETFEQVMRKLDFAVERKNACNDVTVLQDKLERVGERFDMMRETVKGAQMLLSSFTVGGLGMTKLTVQKAVCLLRDALQYAYEEKNE